METRYVKDIGNSGLPKSLLQRKSIEMSEMRSSFSVGMTKPEVQKSTQVTKFNEGEQQKEKSNKKKGLVIDLKLH